MDKEWRKEQERIHFIQTLITQKIQLLQQNLGGLKEGIIELRKHFWDDVTVNLDEADDLGETFTSIKQQVELLAERERTHGQSYQQLRQLLRLKESPYFGRIDFKEVGENSTEKIYIGTTSLMDEKNEEFLIYDWRAPISSLYYDYSPGEAAYETPVGTIEGTMELKRQFIIKHHELKGMFDTGITIGDRLLQEVLGGNANTQMQSIVATIQREQNQIIRNEKGRYLIVQGVAGSGKTSAALQRVAYLLYRYRRILASDNIMLFSPNPLFNSYVATVLPELGEENMEQTTYQQYLLSRFGKRFTVEGPFAQMEYTLTAMDDPAYETRMSAIRFKASTVFKQLIDSYADQLSERGLIFKKIVFRGQVILPAQEIYQYFYSLDSTYSIPNRLTLTSQWILKELNKFEREERKKDWVLEEAELLDHADYVKVFEKIQKGRFANEDYFDDAELEQKILAKSIVRRHLKPIRKAIKQFGYLNMKAIYLQMFNFESVLSLPDHWQQIGIETKRYLQTNHIPYEDATPFLYLQDLLEGRKTNTKIRHLVIDEAQDYSPFQFEFLKLLFPHAKMTILGDVNQAIYAHTNHAPSLLNLDFPGEEKIILTRSYRSTKQIVEFTKALIPSGDMIEPFNREGNKPTVTVVNDIEMARKSVIDKVTEMKEHGYETIAIICKTAKESLETYEQLKSDLHVRMLDNKASSYEKGTVILPAYLAKGIEFDAVIIHDASRQQYGREEERNLFYTACTRAMHELHLFSMGERTPFLNGISSELFIEQ